MILHRDEYLPLEALLTTHPSGAAYRESLLARVRAARAILPAPDSTTAPSDPDSPPERHTAPIGDMP